MGDSKEQDLQDASPFEVYMVISREEFKNSGWLDDDETQKISR